MTSSPDGGVSPMIGAKRSSPDAGDDTSNHPAVRAFAEVGGNPSGKLRVTTLKAQKSKSAVYRIDGLDGEPTPIVAKRSARSVAVVEREIYQGILGVLPVPNLAYLGFLDDQDVRYAWQFLEYAGDGLYDPATVSHRRLSGRWLARLHVLAREYRPDSALPGRDAQFFLSQAAAVRDAIALSAENEALSSRDRRVLEEIDLGLRHVLGHRDAVAETCHRFPATLVHGDFVRKNIRLRERGEEVDFFALDWETAGWGVPAVDLSRVVGEPVLPDLIQYRETLRSLRHEIPQADIDALTALGGVFRMISAMSWAASRLSHPWIEKCMVWMRSYHEDMETVLRVNPWGKAFSLGRSGPRRPTEPTWNRSTTRTGGSPSLPEPPKRVVTHEEAERLLLEEAARRRASRRYPSSEDLEAFLTQSLRARGVTDGAIVVVHRDRSGRSSTFANEVVTCRLEDGLELRILCKYARGNAHPAFGHRGGIEYEIFVYTELLDQLGLSTPRYFGSRFAPEVGEHWLAMEYLEGGVTVNKGPQPASIISAAQWVGAYHAKSTSILDDLPLEKFISYDDQYFAGWATRVRRFAEPLHTDLPWLTGLCDRFIEFAGKLASQPKLLAHGEFTVHNVLLRDGETPPELWRQVSRQVGGVEVAPIDWESAAVTFGEIDLAFLLDGTWPDDMKAVCVTEYAKNRWGMDVPPEFEDRLEMARLYMHLRWLGDRPEKTMLKKTSWRFDELHSLGRRFGLI